MEVLHICIQSIFFVTHKTDLWFCVNVKSKATFPIKHPIKYLAKLLTYEEIQPSQHLNMSVFRGENHSSLL